MKKILSIALSSMLLLTGCDLDINDNPNYPANSTVTTDLIFPSAENFIADCVGDQMFNYAGFFVQYFDQMPTANQYNDLAELNINEGKDLFNRCYSNLYAGALADLQEIISRTDNEADIFACTVLRAYAFQLVVDNLDYAPYTEALQGASNATPKWDAGKDVYEGVLAEMDAAEAKLQPSSVMTVTDPMLSKSIAQWKGFANALRLRMLFRLIDGNVNVSENTAKVKSLVANNEFFTGDVAWDVYSNAEGQYNPWYGTFFKLGAKNHCAAYPLISYLTATSDPRISYVLLPRGKDGKYVGQIPGAKTTEPGWLSLSTSEYTNDYVSNIDYDVYKASPVYLYTQSELQFLIAEAQIRINNDITAAAKSYEAAISNDFASKGVSGVDAFITNPAIELVSGNATESLKRIYMQKWVSLFMRDHMEAWTEARRTDVPAVSAVSGKDVLAGSESYNAGELIVPALNYYGDKGVAKRVPYPSTARTLNKNTPEAKNLSDKVFWDVK